MHIRVSRVVKRSLLAATLAVLLFAGVAGATALTPSAALDSEGQGLTMANGGVGLENLGAGTKTITVNIGGPVQQAVLYWAGRELEGCPQGACFDPPNSAPFGDQELVFEGTAITGSIVGREDDINSNIGYKADVTSIVSAAGTGAQSFDIQDGNTSNNLDRLDGAGLLVLFNDAANPNFYRVIVNEGLDFAYGGTGITFPSPDNTVTTPATFGYGSEASPRTAELLIFAGDGEASRPDRIDITSNPSIFNALDSTDGSTWDTDQFNIAIPGGSSSTSVQLFSAPQNQNPDSFIWTLAALRIPVRGGTEGCTPGYWKTHTSSQDWIGYSPNQDFDTVFGVNVFNPNRSLLAALQTGGGELDRLGRQATAALLSASNSGVDYEFSTSEVIAAVQNAVATGDFSIVDEFESANEAGCPLDGPNTGK